jgi:hypothetical protein
MNINIEVKEINKHFNLKVINNEIDKKKYTSKICKYDFFSVNEASICQIISEIPYYENNFCIICDYDFVNMDQINNETLEKQDKNVKKMEEKYILFQYKKNKFISFNDYLFDITSTHDKPKNPDELRKLTKMIVNSKKFKHIIDLRH